MGSAAGRPSVSALLSELASSTAPGEVEKMVTGSVGSQCRGLTSPTMLSSSFRETRELLLLSKRCSWDLRVGDHIGCGCNTTGDMVTSTGWWDHKQK